MRLGRPPLTSDSFCREYAAKTKQRSGGNSQVSLSLQSYSQPVLFLLSLSSECRETRPKVSTIPPRWMPNVKHSGHGVRHRPNLTIGKAREHVAGSRQSQGMKALDLLDTRFGKLPIWSIDLTTQCSSMRRQDLLKRHKICPVTREL